MKSEKFPLRTPLNGSFQHRFSEVSGQPGAIEIDRCAPKRLARKEGIQFLHSHKTGVSSSEKESMYPSGGHLC